jgi:hypothetical protein
MNNDSAVVDDILVYDGPIWKQEVFGRPIRIRYFTDTPISQTIPIVSSDAKIFARTSHECRMVSPIKLKMGGAVKSCAYLLRNDPDSHIHWSQIDE